MTTLPQRTGFEYRSKEDINGWPLIHINIGTNPETGRAKVANGVVAIGNVAFGIVSIGGVAFGVVTVAGVGLGVVSLSAIALGLVALGPVAFGYEFALGAIVLSAKSAIGAIGLSSNFVDLASWIPLQFGKMQGLLMNIRQLLG